MSTSNSGKAAPAEATASKKPTDVSAPVDKDADLPANISGDGPGEALSDLRFGGQTETTEGSIIDDFKGEPELPFTEEK